MAPISNTRSEELDCFSSVPTKNNNNKKKKSPGSSPESQNQKGTDSTTDPPKRDAKCSPVTQTLLFLVQTFSCNFILESLWIPGTSILKYSIYRLNYETLSVCEDTVCTAELFHVTWCIGLCAPSFCRMIMQKSVTVAMQAAVQGRKPHDWTGRRLCEKTCLTVSCIVTLDCRRLVKHENVPSNFQTPLFMCVCTKM